jgi:HEAT repeat protein
MSSGDGDGSGNWLDRLEDAEFSESDERIDAGLLKPPISGSDVPELCRLLHGGERGAIRRSAAEALGSLADATTEYSTRLVDGLTRAIRADDDPEVRAEAIDALYRHDPAEVERLVKTMRTAIERNDNTDATAFFRRWLAADQPGFRLVAAIALGTTGEEEVISDLKSAFTDTDRRVQARAIEAYARVGSAVDAEPLERPLRSDDPMVRRAAAEALAEIGTEAALESLLPAAESDDDRLRRIAVEELHRLDRRRTADALTTASRDRSRTVRREALGSLIKLSIAGESVRPGEIRDRLLEASKPGELAELAELLAEIATAGGSETEGESLRIRQQAVWLLGEAADRTDREEVHCRLVETLESADETVAGIAAAYLRRLEGEALEAELRSMSRNPDVAPEARARAESVLDAIKRSAASEVESRSIEYTYVRRPTDYTEKHGG